MNFSLHPTIEKGYNSVNLTINSYSKSSISGEERPDALMDEKVQPVVHLEITVPHIAFPSEHSQQQPAASGQDDGQEQVRVLTPMPPDQHSSRQSASGPTEISGEGTTYTSAAGPFRLFRMKDIPLQGQTLLLQVLRRVMGTSGPLSLSAEQAFSIEFQQHVQQDQALEQAAVSSVSSPALLASPSHLIPGLNRIVIFLDEEGTPDSFHIDSAEG